MNKTVLKIHDLHMESREFGNMTHVSFHVENHDVLGLLGLDGSGIELLRRVLCGDTEVFDGARGAVWLNDREVRHASELWGRVRYMRMADAILEGWSVAEYLEMSRVGFFIGNRQKQMMQRRAEEKFRELGRSVDATQQMRAVSECDRRTARIIHEMERGIQLLIIEDECLGMKPIEIREYAEVLKKVSEKGVPILFRARSLQVAEQICENFLVFRRGRLVKRWKQNTSADSKLLTQYLLGQTIAAEINVLQRTRREVREHKNISYQVQDLQLEGKRYRYRFHEGEVTAFVIENNLYCRDFFDQLSGRRIDITTRYYRGFRTLRSRKQQDFIRNRIVSTMLGNEDDELFRNMSVEDNLLMPSLQKFSALRYFQQSDNLHKVTRGLLKNETERRSGNVGRVIDQNSRIRIDMERWLMFRPEVLILYEPFSVCDAYGVTLIASYIQRFANIGTSVIIVKSNEEFLLELVDHVYRIEV